MKYIVFWILTELVSVPCPDAAKADEFGNIPEISISCSVNHLEERSSHKQREFNNLDSATAFIELAKKRDDIDSIRLETKF